MVTYSADPFRALADPTRRAVLEYLAGRPHGVNELCEHFDVSRPAISKHLKVLETAGLITQGREAQWRPRRLAAAPLKDIADWLDQYRRFWEERFDRLDAYLHQLQRKPQPREKKSGRKK